MDFDTLNDRETMDSKDRPTTCLAVLGADECAAQAEREAHVAKEAEAKRKAEDALYQVEDEVKAAREVLLAAERKVRKIKEEQDRQAAEEAELKTGDQKTITLPGGATMEMIYVGPGEFIMGSPTTENGSRDETPHRVRLTRGYWLGKYEVTQAQWESVMGNNPSYFEGSKRPVDSVSWDDCQEFIKKVNASSDLTVRLPTEAEWEYACRAGTTTAYSWGNALNGDKANCRGNYPYGTTVKGQYKEATVDVGSYEANQWGFYDMHGNVSEWCQDWYGDSSNLPTTDPKGPASGDCRVRRGGGWNSGAEHCRSANRGWGCPDETDDDSGFRLACSADALHQAEDEVKAAREVLLTAEREEQYRQAAEEAEFKTGDQKTITLPGGATMEMIYVGPGEFMMGSPTTENGRKDEDDDEAEDDETQHRVRLTKGYWLGKYEVTQAQWESVMGDNPSRFKGFKRPVENVSWYDCQKFIEKVNARSDFTVRLPTEAEWEYACRAGSTTAIYTGDLTIRGESNAPELDRIAWYAGNSSVDFELSYGSDCSSWPEKQYNGNIAGTHPVGKKDSNAWGFYDMLGNVWEWCQDWWGFYSNQPTTDPKGPASERVRVLRGGDWGTCACDCRSANRGWDRPYETADYDGLYGFRLACSALPLE